MVPSFYTAISGSKSMQVAMDTWGDNIANVDTVGFRGSNVEFDSLLNQSLAQAASGYNAAGAGIGTVNQIGLGVRVSATTMVTTQGSIKQTDKNFDLAINGNGWFAVQGPNNNQPAYTRNGTFNTDASGNFETTQGYKVLGMTSSSMSVDESGTGTLASLTPPTNLLSQTAQPIVLPYQMTCPGIPGSDAVINSLPAQTQTYVSGNNMKIEYALPFSTPATVVITDANGAVVNTLYPPQGMTGTNSIEWNGENANGEEMPDGEYNVTVNYVQTPAVAAIAEGNLLAYNVEFNGEIVAGFDNGLSVTVAQIPLYNFQNEQGLERMGDNLYSTSDNSGDAFIMTDTVTGLPTNGAVIQSYALELSNVSLSESMTNLIVTQRSFEANAKCIKTSDDMIQRAISLKK